jgi:hypothetical protein
VDDPTGRSYGTGTIIDVHGDEALVVTCGHLFRESQGNGQITVELLSPMASGPIPGQLIAYDADNLDIGLVSIRPQGRVTVASVAPNMDGIVRGASVFSVGCDHGEAPRIQASQVTAIDKYQGRHEYAQNIEVAGQPVDGRSGGGLFDVRGRLIGICNAADPQDDEGIYAGLRTIHWQLDQIGLSQIYQAGAELAASDAPSQPVGSVQQATAVQPLPVTRMSAVGAQPNLLTALESGAEVICVVRGPTQRDGQVLVLDQASRDLLTRLVRESQETASLTVRGQN